MCTDLIFSYSLQREIRQVKATQSTRRGWDAVSCPKVLLGAKKLSANGYHMVPITRLSCIGLSGVAPRFRGYKYPVLWSNTKDPLAHRPPVGHRLAYIENPPPRHLKKKTLSIWARMVYPQNDDYLKDLRSHPGFNRPFQASWPPPHIHWIHFLSPAPRLALTNVYHRKCGI